jgi:TonB family protein
LLLALAVLAPTAFSAQQRMLQSSSGQDFSQEPFVYQTIHTTMRYENDGNGSREIHARILVQNQAGLAHAGQLLFDYNSENETVEIREVRVLKPDGSILVTGPENIQDLSAPVAQLAPVYSDARQKHVTVAGLSVGDTVEYEVVTTLKPLVSGQFWYSFHFESQAICLDERVELDVPKDRMLKIKSSPGLAPEIWEEGERRLYRWKTSNLSVPKPLELLKSFQIDVLHMLEGARPSMPQKIAFSSFQSWQDVGNWYASLERDRREPTAAVRAQADEIVRGKTSEVEKAEALYEWVARNIRYVSLSFGVGRYQPHAAAAVLANRYGDCKDKTTLLEAFFAAERIHANAALVNVLTDVDLDVPTILAFDHVITVASVGRKDTWLDPTIGAIPFGYLLPQLRGQNALVVSTAEESAIRKTPEELAIPTLYKLDVTGAVDENAGLDATVKFSIRGDLEVLLRLFNSIFPPAQFTSFVQEAMTKGNKTSYGPAKFTDFRLENPSDTSKPLQGQFHFVGLLTYVNLRETSPENLVNGVYSALLAKSKGIGWSGKDSANVTPSFSPAEFAGPKEYALSVAVTVPRAKLTGTEKPTSSHLASEFGEYQASAKWEGQTWRADWRLSLRGSEVPVGREKDYLEFKDSVLGALREAQTKTITAKNNPEPTTSEKTNTSPTSSVTSSTTKEPPSQQESPAQALYLAARRAGNNREYTTCAQLLEEAVAKDPNHKFAWDYLGWTYNTLGKYEKAEAALRRAIALNPSDSISYNNLGQALAGQKRYEEAIPQYQKQIELNPRDQWAHANLGRVYVLLKQYEKAIPELETAASIKPDDPYIPFNLGRAYAKTGQPEKAAKSLMRSVDLQPVPFRWNAVAYEMALDNLELKQAQKYAESAVAATVIQMQSTSLDHVTNDDIRLTAALAAYWDTLGWITFQQGSLPEAEKYVRCAWLLHSTGEVTDHLGQIYEKEGRKAEAIRFYALALATTQPMPETRGRLALLLGGDETIDALIEEAKPQLKEARTIQIKNPRRVEGIAEFWVLLSPGPKIHAVKFITGDEELSQLSEEIQAASYPDCFPDGTELQLIRRGRLSCPPSSLSCNLFLNSAETVQPMELSGVGVPSDTPQTRVRLGGNILSQKIRFRVDPTYPLEARTRGIEGTVRLHAIIAKDGSVMQLQVVSGPPTLTQATLDAVRQWRYEPTLLNGQAVEVDTTIDVVFQVNKKN